MPNPDSIRLHHMRDAAANALEIVSGDEEEDLSSIVMLSMALTRCLEVVGESRYGSR
jgi:hypothetical protein